MKHKRSIIYTLFLGLALSAVALSPAYTAHKALSWGDIKGFFQYIGSIPDKIEDILNDANEVVENKYAEAEDSIGEISEYIFSPLTTASDTKGLNKALGLGKLSQVSTKEGSKVIAKGLAKFADILKPAAETLGALTADVPDEVGVMEAWIDFKGSAFFASTGATLAGGLALAVGATASAPVLAVGGVVGAIVYGLTGDKITDAAGDALADRMSNETGAHITKRRKKCESIQQRIEKNPNLVVRLNKRDIKRCLGLGVDILRSKKCSKYQRWHKFLGKCASRSDFLTYCKNKYSGTVPWFKSPSLCKCPSGTKWSKKYRRCKKQRTKTSGKYASLCAIAKGGSPMFVWDRRGRRYGCQDPRLGSKNFSARKTPIIVGVPSQVKGKKVDCPVSSWPPKSIRVKCVPKNSRSPKPGYCATYRLYHVNKRITQKYCYYIQ